MATRAARQSAYSWAPPKWLQLGELLQADNGGSRGLQVYVGLDFGSAYTKVAIATSQLEQPLIVNWNPLRAQAEHYFPGEVSQLPDGGLLPGDIKGGELHANLKIPLLDGCSGEPATRARTIGFLAWVLRYSRAWFFHHHADLTKGRKIQWTLNIGCPSETYAGALSADYESLARRAWIWSQTSAPLRFQEILSSLTTATSKKENGGLLRAKAVPEFLAEIAGYVFSRQRNEGLHLLIDVGAGTVDVACFIVHKISQLDPNDPGRLKFPIFAASVKPLGTHFLVTARRSAAGAQSDSPNTGSGQTTPSIEKMAHTLNVEPKLLRDADDQHSRQVSQLIGIVLEQARKGYSNAPEWTQGVPTFLVGGGSSVQAYRDAFDRAAAGRLKLTKLTYPLFSTQSKLSDPRLLVAAGLTKDSEKLGDIILPNDIPPHLHTRTSQPKDHLTPDRDADR